MVRLKNSGFANCIDIQYRDLTTDPISTVKSIYKRFERPFSSIFDENIRKYMINNPQNKHGLHKYVLEGMNLTPPQIEKLFSNYYKLFHVPHETKRENL